LSGTYDIYLVTCPISLKDFSDTADYKFQVKIWERINKEGKTLGEYPSSASYISNPDETSGKYFYTYKHFDDDGFREFIDTTYIGAYTFSNAYYSRSEEGVIFQIYVNVGNSDSDNHVYSRNMLINSLILKPHDSDATPTPVSGAKKRATSKDINYIINKKN
jgi:hypothetical protein